jgi:hypothetical protein
MRTTILCISALLLTSNISAAEDLPKRKAGLWEIKTTVKDLPNRSPKALQCVDEATDAAMLKIGQGMTSGACSENSTKKEGKNFVSDSVCTIGGSKIESHAVFSGDFQSAYKAEIESKYEPPLMGRTESHTILEAKHIGPCKEGQVPGDVVMENGMKMNILKMSNAG